MHACMVFFFVGYVLSHKKEKKKKEKKKKKQQQTGNVDASWLNGFPLCGWF